MDQREQAIPNGPCAEFIIQNNELAEALQKTKSYAKELEDFINQVTTPPLAITRAVSGLIDGYVRIIMNNEHLIIPVSQDILDDDEKRAKIKEGALIHVKSGGPEMKAAVNVEEYDAKMQGGIGTVLSKIDERLYEIETRGENRICYSEHPIELGKKVCIDNTSNFVNYVLDDNDAAKFKVEEGREVTWNQVGGLEEAKETLKDLIETPYLYKELYESYGKKPAKGALLFGPPGCGKTLLGRAVATSLSNGEGMGGFIYVKGPEILSQWVGVAEANIRKLFAESRRYYQKSGHPAIIFIDEADSVLFKRGTGKSSDIEKTTVPQFLSEMDGIEDSGAIVLLSTNRPDTLDPAVVREGRIDKKIYVPRPKAQDSESILDIHIGDKPIAGIDKMELVKTVITDIFSEDRVLYDIKLSDSRHVFTLGNLISGAMIAALVDQATTNAIRRNIAEKEPKIGITLEDMRNAVQEIESMNRNINHEDDIANFCEERGEEIVSINKVQK